MSIGIRSLLCFLLLALSASGCQLLLPEVMHQPMVHNPFPQFSKVAILPFFNQSNEPTVDGKQFALDYFTELQSVPGFEVIPVGVVEQVAKQLGVDLSSADGRRLLANQLGADVLVIGTVTDFSPYYPPRCGLRVDWYAANAGFHEIPAGYGLPWGTPQEEFIPEGLVFEAEMALARKQMDTQTPEYTPPRIAMQAMPDGTMQPKIISSSGPMDPMQSEPSEPKPFPLAEPKEKEDLFNESNELDTEGKLPSPPESLPAPPNGVGASQASFEAPIDETAVVSPNGLTIAPNGSAEKYSEMVSLPPDWPDARGFTPPGPVVTRPLAKPFDGPVITHTRVFRGTDTEFTAALASYVGFKDDARFGGWQSYLDRSDDFIRFCCHLHITEMLSARGGGGESRVVRQWSSDR